MQKYFFHSGWERQICLIQSLSDSAEPGFVFLCLEHCIKWKISEALGTYFNLPNPPLQVCYFLEALASSLYFQFLGSVDLAMLPQVSGVEEVKTKDILSLVGQAQSIQTIFLQRQKHETRLHCIVPVKVLFSVD